MLVLVDVEVHVYVLVLVDIEVNVDRLMLVDFEIDGYVLGEFRALVKLMFWCCSMLKFMCKCF